MKNQKQQLFTIETDASTLLPYPTENETQNEKANMAAIEEIVAPASSGAWCPNCGAVLEGRKCKLFCLTPGCGYLVTCSEW